jgi:hypothetical protein
LFSFEDDAAVVGARFALQPRMAEKTLEERVSLLEAQLENKTLEQHFRELAELIDRLFVYRFEGLDKKRDAKLDVRLANLEDKLDATLSALGESLESRVELRIDARLKPVKADLVIIKHAVGVILTRLT